MRQSQDKAPARPAPATAGSRTREPWQPALCVSAPADAPRDPLCGRDGERGGSETPPGSPCALTPTRSSWFRGGVAPGRAVQPAAKTLFFIANKGQAQPRKSRRALQHAGSSSWHEPAQPEGHQREGSPRSYKALTPEVLFGAQDGARIGPRCLHGVGGWSWEGGCKMELGGGRERARAPGKRRAARGGSRRRAGRAVPREAGGQARQLAGALPSLPRGPHQPSPGLGSAASSQPCGRPGPPTGRAQCSRSLEGFWHRSFCSREVIGTYPSKGPRRACVPC